ncbi:uncharacterized protein LOC133333398 [Musca vetustissima]|uniref:uncharacterized protein LOC133329851 n=1 Tax=Musca vetustissima TaxID=27455 RepID=UPI002AB7CF3A|nr:uncharacterized protein LOC133329851 [Musca vetustissima]XP_061397700.1 uncharacterized protein LOC133333398 [Musca vetustissima]
METSIEKITELKYRLEIVKEEIFNVEFAIEWAKAGVINSFIFSKVEIDLLQKIFNNSEIPFNSVDELLKFAKIKVASDSESLIYIVSIPTTNNENCNCNILKPVKFANSIYKIKFNKILICKNNLLGIKNKCDSYENLSICSEENTETIKDSDCIANLLQSKPSTCAVTNNDDIPSVEQINEDLIFLNQYSGEILINDSPLTLNGTFIIHHAETNVTIDGRYYYAKKETGIKPLPALVQPKETDEQIETLSLEFMKSISINNTKIIETMQKRERINFGIGTSIFLTLTIIIAVILRNKRYHKNPESSIKITTSEKEDKLEEITTSDTPCPSAAKRVKSLNNIPFF